MCSDLIRSFAQYHKIPLAAVQRFATSIAEQCALIATRHEPDIALTFEQLAAVETLGAEIGEAIINEFPAAEPEGRAEVDPLRYGIRGPGG